MTINGSAIANDALRYNGAGYQFGGSPANGIGKWDCSSFVSWVMGHDLKMSIPLYPNGTYTGTAHGATAAMYLTWVGATSIPRNQTAAGDLCCWLTHIGIATAENQMISAYDTNLGTLVTGITGAGPTGEGKDPIIRRVNGTVGQQAGVSQAGSTLSGCKFPGSTAGLIVMTYALSHRTKRRRYLQSRECTYRQSSRKTNK